VWLYGTLVLAERRSGYIIMLVGSPPGVGHARNPRDGRGRRFSRPDRQVQPSLLVRLDASRARRDWDLLPHPLGARTVEPATGPAPVVEEPEPWNIRRTAGLVGAHRFLIPGSRLSTLRICGSATVAS